MCGIVRVPSGKLHTGAQAGCRLCRVECKSLQLSRFGSPSQPRCKFVSREEPPRDAVRGGDRRRREPRVRCGRGAQCADRRCVSCVLRMRGLKVQGRSGRVGCRVQAEKRAWPMTRRWKVCVMRAAWCTDRRCRGDVGVQVQKRA